MGTYPVRCPAKGTGKTTMMLQYPKELERSLYVSLDSLWFANHTLQDVPNSYVVNDEVEVGFGNKIPLWLLGFLY